MTIDRARRSAVPPTDGGGSGGDDYSVAFTLAYPDANAHSARDWARAVFEGSPAALRPVLIVGWRLGLRLRLGPLRSPTHVLGWQVTEDEPGRIVLTAPSPLVEASNAALVEASAVTWVTRVRYRRAAGRLLWKAAAPVHERTLPLLLTRAGRALAAPRDSGD
ncbi:conserved hypothetical protein [Frankia canadensis]|uniref:DUF2867 domain-containing protein n=1 Tax=Frankia canadensis TaxID=1836972 RepID=A0A2I2L1Z6_9ACTN|nr:DUF2867 domain-containing protein [Frankia canadensis]SNQ51925.1 conserved hypothetical protein [Frankia canadensis]SOU59215.1 conserved hypothetical protein [Frankia canadensis]